MEWWFFTRKYYNYNKSSRSNRSTKKGYWEITGKEPGIKARRSKAEIGNKRTLTFYQDRVPKSNKTSWVILEYYLPGNVVISYTKQAQGDFVICRLKIKSDEKDSSVSNEGEPGSAGVSNCENQAADEMNQEGREELLFHQPQPLDDCCPSALQSPTSQELEAVLQTNSTNDDCIKLQSPFGDGGSCLLDGNKVSTCDEDETVCDVFPHCSPQYCSHQYTQSWEMFQMGISILVNAIIGNLHLRKKFQPMKLTYQLDISCLILKIKLQIL